MCQGIRIKLGSKGVIQRIPKEISLLFTTSLSSLAFMNLPYISCQYAVLTSPNKKLNADICSAAHSLSPDVKIVDDDDDVNHFSDENRQLYLVNLVNTFLLTF